MKVRMALAFACAVALALPAAAADKATFVLRGGQRVTGTLAAHGSQMNNLIDGQFNLDGIRGGTGNLSEKAFPQSEVVAIDFTGGSPSARELSALNNLQGNPNLLVLRDGSLIYGQFQNITHGTTVLFTQNGQQRSFNASQVARVYLDASGARQAYNAPAGAPVATAGQGAGSPLQVSAAQPWTDTGITVRAGEMVAFQATGDIEIGNNFPAATADGIESPQLRGRSYPVPNMAAGGLIARVGNGRAFPVGTNTQPIRMPSNGRLYLGINDDRFQDNRGAFNVVVTPQTSSVGVPR